MRLLTVLNHVQKFILANSDNFEPQPKMLTDSTARLFWGIQLRCAECHDHRFAPWKQSDFWETVGILIPGFTEEDALPMRGDFTAVRPAWNEVNWSELDGELVALRIHMQNASLYSFWTREDEDHISLVNLVPTSD